MMSEATEMPKINKKAIRQLYRVTLVTSFIALVFCLFFQICKHGPFREVNPFGIDPYEAVGSFLVQAAFLIDLLTCGRALQLSVSPEQQTKSRLIIRGNFFVFIAITIALITDAIAEVIHPFLKLYFGRILLLGLVSMSFVTALGIIAVILVFRRIKTEKPPDNLTPADSIDDLWTLVRIPAAKLRRLLPRSFIGWIQRCDSDRLFASIPFLNPRLHSWRFAVFVGFLAGIGLALLQLQEGLPPSFKAGLTATTIIVLGEFSGVFLGFLLFGGYLGLRPSLRKK